MYVMLQKFRRCRPLEPEKGIYAPRKRYSTSISATVAFAIVCSFVAFQRSMFLDAPNMTLRGQNSIVVMMSMIASNHGVMPDGPMCYFTHVRAVFAGSVLNSMADFAECVAVMLGPSVRRRGRQNSESDSRGQNTRQCVGFHVCYFFLISEFRSDFRRMPVPKRLQYRLGCPEGLCLSLLPIASQERRRRRFLPRRGRDSRCHKSLLRETRWECFPVPARRGLGTTVEHANRLPGQ
jgi:hypothetical protein